jgi:hypothetical protein
MPVVWLIYLHAHLFEQAPSSRISLDIRALSTLYSNLYIFDVERNRSPNPRTCTLRGSPNACCPAYFIYMLSHLSKI